MTKKEKIKCYTYIRVSTEIQVDGYSLDAQKDMLTKYAEYQGMEIVHEYCDAGKSGKSITGRPEFSQMLKDVADEKDGVDYILVFKLSRFGRNAADVLNSLQYIQDFGVNLICVEDGIDSSKESGKLTITVLSAVAEIERENILVQTMEGRKQKAREGKWNGGIAPYGYRLDKENGTLVVDEDEAKVVRLIFERFTKTNDGFDSISAYLNSHGYRKRKQRERDLEIFDRKTIREILDNPVYLGKIAYGRRKTVKIKGTRDQYRRAKQDDYLLVDGKHEAIIDEATWEAAKEKRENTGFKNVKRYSMDHAYVYSGLLRCPKCGAKMTGIVCRHRSKKTGEVTDTFYYRCHHRSEIDGQKCDCSLNVREDRLDGEMKEILTKITAGESFKKFIIEKLKSEVDVTNLNEELEQTRTQIRRAEAAKEKLLDRMDHLDPEDRHYDRKMNDMQDRLDDLYDKISALSDTAAETDKKIEAAQGEKISADHAYRLLENYSKIYGKMTDLEKKEFMNLLIDHIEAYEDPSSAGRIIKSIDFVFPICFDGTNMDNDNLLTNVNTDETIVLLQRQNS